MNTYLKSVGFALAIITTITYSANAHPKGPILFNFTLTVKNVSDPQIFIGGDSIPQIGKNIFKVNARKSDHFFTIKYKQNDKNKAAICLISGAPKLISATIDTTKDGRDACHTEESSQLSGIAAL